MKPKYRKTKEEVEIENEKLFEEIEKNKKPLIKSEFLKWFPRKFWKISGRFLLPSAKELEEIAEACYDIIKK